MNAAASERVAGARSRARALIEHRYFNVMIVALILANAIGLETSLAFTAPFGETLHVFDQTVMRIFVVD